MSDSVTPLSQINITLGTAGHIDHGKTALLKLLTGCETDRLKEEKARGVSIELGFAPCRLGDLEVGIVDVPGHENFIKTMVAGASGIDGVVFVVAADDGVMPQTREHLEILTLLGVRYGMVVLTKTDLVTPEQVRFVQNEVKGFLQGTFLEDAVVCPMSSVTGAGFDLFYTELKNLIQRISPKTTEGVFRLPVERVFSAKGFGTVVSGIPVSGSIRIGDELILLPAGRTSRLKAAQVYGRDAETAKCGQCAALNLPQLDYKIVQRGDVLTQEGYFEPSRWFLCELSLLESTDFRIKNGIKVKFHTGTSEITSSIYSICLSEPDTPLTGWKHYIQIQTAHPIVAGPCDRFILRSLSPARTIGGGSVIEALPRKLKRSHIDPERDIFQRSAAVKAPESFIEYAVQTARRGAARPPELAFRVKQPIGKVQLVLRSLIENRSVVELPSRLFIHKKTLDRVNSVIIKHLETYHSQEPHSAGIPEKELADYTGFDKGLFDGALNLLLEHGRVIIRKDRIALPTHREQFDPHQQSLLEKVEDCFKKDMFRPPRSEELPALTKIETAEVNHAVRLLIEHKRLIRVSHDMIFHATAVKTAQERIAEHIRGKGQGRLESVDFKYLIDTTRKYALPLLDYMDKIGFTRRVGNTRYLKS